MNGTLADMFSDWADQKAWLDSAPKSITPRGSQAQKNVEWSMMTTVAELQAEIAGWADSVVPNRTPLSVIAKMLGEVGELIASERMSDPSEIADVLILALDLAHLQGIDAAEAIRNKLEINKGRKWQVADNGCAQHIN